MKAAVEFATGDAALRALRAVKALGYLDVETHSPFPLTDDQSHAPRGSVALSILAVGGALVGLAAAYFVQWYANAWSYPLNIGGRPAHATPAFIPATFETVCLLATVGVFGGFLLIERLPRLWQPAFEIEGFDRCSIDRFWLVLDLHGDDDDIEQVRHRLLPLHPLRILVSEEVT